MIVNEKQLNGEKRRFHRSLRHAIMMYHYYTVRGLFEKFFDNLLFNQCPCHLKFLFKMPTTTLMK